MKTLLKINPKGRRAQPLWPFCFATFSTILRNVVLKYEKRIIRKRRILKFSISKLVIFLWAGFDFCRGERIMKICKLI